MKVIKILLCMLALTMLIAWAEHKPMLKRGGLVQITKNEAEESVQRFLDHAESYLNKLHNNVSRARWIHGNFITFDTSELEAEAIAEHTAAIVRLAHEASEFNHWQLSADSHRKLEQLKLSLTLPAPQDVDKNQQLSRITTELSNIYGKGQFCRDDGCMTLGEINGLMSKSRDYDELLQLWVGWHNVAKPMRFLYEQEVVLSNEGARELGYDDVGVMWRSKYDMPPETFASEINKLWLEVKPLYQSLHCHVRAKLGEWYGDSVVPSNQPIPSHLLGNMWAQTWVNIYPIVAPKENQSFDLTSQFKEKGYDELKIVKTAEQFFTSIGFTPLPDTFYQRSLFTKPQDRDVHCHASAWSLDGQEDIRIKMCIQRTEKGFHVVHHELGHNFYQRAYRRQPFLYQRGANDGFHEAIGDTIALSVTPKYLKEIGLLDKVPDESKDIGLLMKMALDKVAFIPFGLLVDQWRWKVYSGEVTPENYNTAWWELREKYQGVTAPVERDANAFDPGAKYHVPGGVPYSRYFLAHIQQFEFHRALCEISGNTDPIHRCSIYNNKDAGAALNTMLEMGSSKPWQEAYKVLTGNEQMDATAIIDYFAPLHSWLKEKNQGKQCGF
ncbi:MAG: M2 family metallopeptidase [Endozoicomonas sp.]